MTENLLCPISTRVEDQGLCNLCAGRQSASRCRQQFAKPACQIARQEMVNLPLVPIRSSATIQMIPPGHFSDVGSKFQPAASVPETSSLLRSKLRAEVGQHPCKRISDNCRQNTKSRGQNDQNEADINMTGGHGRHWPSFRFHVSHIDTPHFRHVVGSPLPSRGFLGEDGAKDRKRLVSAKLGRRVRGTSKAWILEKKTGTSTSSGNGQGASVTRAIRATCHIDRARFLSAKVCTEHLPKNLSSSHETEG